MAAPSFSNKYEHIEFDEKGIPKIAGTNMKVVELILDHKGHGWSPEELHFQHPSLSMGKIHAALAYYWDNREEIEKDIDRRSRKIRKLSETAGPSPFAARLKANGLL